MANKLYVRGMEVKIPENHNGYFFGEHSTGYGNVWDAVFGAAEKFLVFIRMVLQKGNVVFKNLKTKNSQYSGIKYCEDDSFSV